MDRDFKGVWIPADLWLDTSISPIQKFFLLEIDSFNTKEGCFASNKHFANLFGLSVGRCSEIISILVEKGLVEKRLIYEGKVVKKRTLKPVLGVLGKPKGGTRKTEGGYSENTKGTNTNITKDNKDRCNVAKKVFKRPEFDDIKLFVKEKNLTVDCEVFFDHYEANGWMAGKVKMKDWKATLRNWHRRNTGDSYAASGKIGKGESRREHHARISRIINDDFQRAVEDELG